jgi:hypothetical protein
MSDNRADLFQPVYSSHIGPAPIVIRAVVTTNNDYVAGGMPQAQLKAENYVLMSALPKELQERVRVAVQSIISGQ